MEWIPFNETKPHDGQDCLVTHYPRGQAGPVVARMTYRMAEDTADGFWWEDDTSPATWWPLGWVRVTAWMPWPEPYKATPAMP